MKLLSTAPGERLDLDLEDMSGDTDDDVSFAHLLSYIYIHVFFFLSY